MRIRVQGPSGVQTCEIDATASLGELRALLARVTGVPASAQHVRERGTMRVVVGADSESISALGIHHGTALLLDAASTSSMSSIAATTATTAPSATAVAAAAVASSSASNGAKHTPSQQQQTQQQQQQQQHTPSQQQHTQQEQQQQQQPQQTPSQQKRVRVDEDGGVVVRRPVPADNSCLFSSVAYALQNRSRTGARALRELVASYIERRQPVFDQVYDDVVLGKPVDEYVRWIRQGAIEIGILAFHFHVEIMVFEIETVRTVTFGEGHDYENRIFLLYDGLHYDPLVRTPAPDLPEEFDTTIFSTDDSMAVAMALSVAGDAHQARQYTNLAKFTLRCLVCQSGFVGQKEAVVHAKQTGHANFSEYK